MAWSSSCMQSMNTQEYKKNLLDIYLDEILKTIKPSDIIPHLITLKEFDYDVQSDILAREKTDRRKAATTLTTKLRRCEEADWFDLFKDGLKKADYEKLFKKLSLQDIKDEDVFVEMMRTTYPILIKSFRASEVLPILYSRGTISETDHEEIMAETVEMRRAQSLLTRLPKKEGWFYDLVYSFMETKSVKALRTIDPSLVEADSEESLMKMLDKLGLINLETHQHQHQTGFYESDPKKMKELTEDKDKPGTIEESSMHYSVARNDLSVDAQPSCENSEGSAVIDLKEDHDPQSSLCSNDMNINMNRKETFVKQIKKPVDKRLHNAILNLGDDPSSVNISLKSSSSEAAASNRSIRDTSASTSGPSYSFGSRSSTGSSYTFTDQASNLNQLSHMDNKTQSKLINTPNLAPYQSSRPPSSAAASSNSSTSSTASSQPPSSMSHSVPDSSSDKPVELRGYQKELAERAILGRNCIIVAPTGSGKTHVALEISKEHFNSETREPRKIVFFVPKVPLVAQQYDLFSQNMEDNCKIYKLHGEADSDTPISDVIKNNDVLIMTPQVLVNALRDGEVESLSVFTLMIFDECHHATKEHPYNEIMSIYRDAMFLYINQCLPQIVGLTASTGVGKARSVNEASEHILQLCANLAALEICTVQQNKEELEKYVNRLIEDSKYPVEEVEFQLEAVIDLLGGLTSLSQDRKDADCDISVFLNVEYKTCSLCNGFYGPNFNQPVCSTCHMFLFPLDINWAEEGAYAEKADSGDSGNEEPNVETDFYTKQESKNPDRRFFQPVHKTDRLVERINNLSHPRNYRMEKVPVGLVDSLPTEVLLDLFDYLDDISLWTASNVCQRWRQILDAELSPEQGNKFINLRWPLFQPQYHVPCWKTIYTKLYPMKPPVVRFITKIFHPNISRHGDIGLDSIHHNWSLALTISKVLISIQSLLTDPYWYVCMEPAIGRLYQQDRQAFDQVARHWTWKYAMHDYVMPVEIL